MESLSSDPKIAANCAKSKVLYSDKIDSFVVFVSTTVITTAV